MLDIDILIIGIYSFLVILAVWRKDREQLKEYQEKFRILTSNSQEAGFSYTYYPEPSFQYISPVIEAIVGYSAGQFYQNPLLLSYVVHPDDLSLLKSLEEKDQEESCSLVLRLRHKEDRIVWGKLNCKITYNQQGKLISLEGSLQDITQTKKAEEELNLQTAYFQQLFENSPEAIVMLDTEGKIFKANKGFEDLFQFIGKELNEGNIDQMVVPKHLMTEALEITVASQKQGKTVKKETMRKRKDGTLINVSILAYPIIMGKRQVGTYTIYRDITARKESEKQLKYLILHDSLTKLYNRTYFEEKMTFFENLRCAPIAVVVCDLDGLKLVNDTLGHDIGDSLLQDGAAILRKCFGDGDVVARIGGDEFAILLPYRDEKELDRVTRLIKQSIEEYNQDYSKIPISISLGYAVRKDDSISMNNLFKEADNNMYREKLQCRQSARSALVRGLKKTLEVRDFVTDGHAHRLEALVERLAQSMGLSQRQINDLRFLAQFHDIGKVGIPDQILFKPGPLNEEEFAVMQRHCEIGYRIAQSTNEMLPYADWILKHHEWWNGEGYPLQLKGEDIPLECRILAIADAYDAMTSDRPYRKAMSQEQALDELERCTGRQFDPNLVSRFLAMFNTAVIEKR